MTHEHDTDERFDRWVADAAASLREPPPAPRDAMWEAIQARRTAAATPVAIASTPRRFAVRPIWGALAATLLAGVIIGRSFGPTVAPTPATPLASAPSNAVAVVSTASPTVEPPISGSVARATRRAEPASDPAFSPYAVVTREHLGRVDVLLASYAADVEGDSALRDDFTRSARELLSTTRLLIDAPTGRDPERRQLLSDLELVLVQLIQRSGDSADDSAAVARTLDRTHLRARLRSAGPNVLARGT